MMAVARTSRACAIPLLALLLLAAASAGAAVLSFSWQARCALT
eukprot:COSAG06_NODE_69004_length_199_cov_48.990000_1_plen_42_part_01